MLQESELKEVTLEGDNIDGVEYILYRAYGVDPPTLCNTKSIEMIHYLITVYRAIDKYQFATLESSVNILFRELLYRYLDRVDTTAEEPTSLEFCRIVQRVYDLAGAQSGEHRRSHGLINALLARPLCGKDHELLTKAVDDVVEFGQDLCIFILNKIGPRQSSKGLREITYVDKVRCAVCEETWMRPREHVDTGGYESVGGHCYHCGIRAGDWRWRQVR